MVKRWCVRQERIRQANSLVLPVIGQIKSEHPFWGYRWIWAYLRFVAQEKINKKRVYRLLKENNLLVEKNLRLKARRENRTQKPRPTRPNQWWGVDMTKVLTAAGWAYLMVVNDWFTKKILGVFVGERSRAVEWLAAVNEAVNQQFPGGIKDESALELNLMSDNGS